jgi:hypothetical protein
MTDSQNRIVVMTIVSVILFASIREILVCWRDGILRRRIKRRWRDNEWYEGADAWRYGLTKIIESAILAVILIFVLVTWFRAP